MKRLRKEVKETSNTINLITTYLSKNTYSYGDPSDHSTCTNSDSVGVNNYIRLNNLGKAVLILNPSFLLNKEYLKLFQNHHFITFMNGLIANDDDQDFHQFTNFSYITTPNISDNETLNSYKSVMFEFKANNASTASQEAIHDDINNLSELKKNQLRIKLMSGKALNFLIDQNTTFDNRLSLDYINTDNQLFSSFTYNLNDTIYYQVPMMNKNNNKLGFNSDELEPLVIATPDRLQLSTFGKTIISYFSGDDVDGTSSKKYHQLDFKNAIRYVADLVSQAGNQDRYFDKADQYNDKLIKIEIYGEPYQTIPIQMDNYYQVKDNLPIIERTSNDPFTLNVVQQSPQDAVLPATTVSLIMNQPDANLIKKTGGLTDNNLKFDWSWLKKAVDKVINFFTSQDQISVIVNNYTVGERLQTIAEIEELGPIIPPDEFRSKQIKLRTN